MRNILLIIFVVTLFNSCGINRVYTSANYGSLKSYTEKPIYNGKKETGTYISGSINNTKHPQDNEKDDKVVAGNFSIYRTTTHKMFNYYYGIGGGFGTYEFKSDLDDERGIRFFNKDDKLKFYNFNLKTGINLTKTWKNAEYSIIGLEFINIHESGPYMNALGDLPQISKVAVIDEKSIFAFNFNSEIIFRINKDNNLGFGFFLGSVLFADHEKTHNTAGLYTGCLLKYNYKRITINLIKENSQASINSIQVGLTYKVFNQSKPIKQGINN